MQRIFLTGFTLSILACNQVWASAPGIKVPGTRVFLSPPEGFAPAEGFNGFIQKDLNASIIVTEIPGSYEQVSSGFTEKELAGKGMNLTASSAITKDRHTASLIEFTQMAMGKKFKKVACIFGDRVTTTLVTGAMPEDGSKELFATLKEAVKSAHFDPRARLGGIEDGLPFTIADTKKFKKATRLQNTILFTTTGKASPGRDNGPLFVVGHSVGEVAIENRETFAKERLTHTPQLKNIIIDKEKSIKQADLTGEEFLAQGVDVEEGTPTYIFHTVLFENDGYYIFQGLCPISERAVYEPEFQALVKNFHLR